MISRVMFTLLFHFYRVMVMIEPNSNNEMGKEDGDQKHEKGDATNTVQMKILITITMFALSALSLYFRFDEKLTYLDYSMISVATFGLFLSYWSYYILGKFYTFSLGIRKNHKLIKDGPYKYFSHPGYLGQFLIIIGSVIFFRVNIFLTVLLCLYIIYAFRKRIIEEETMMLKQFGKKYERYLANRL